MRQYAATSLHLDDDETIKATVKFDEYTGHSWLNFQFGDRCDVRVFGEPEQLHALVALLQSPDVLGAAHKATAEAYARKVKAQMISDSADLAAIEWSQQIAPV